MIEWTNLQANLRTYIIIFMAHIIFTNSRAIFYNCVVCWKCKYRTLGRKTTAQQPYQSIHINEWYGLHYTTIDASVRDEQSSALRSSSAQSQCLSNIIFRLLKGLSMGNKYNVSWEKPLHTHTTMLCHDTFMKNHWCTHTQHFFAPARAKDVRWICARTR